MLAKLVSNALTAQHAPDKSNTSIATTGMKTSRNAIVALGQGSIQNSGKMASVVPALNGKSITQQQAHTIGRRMGEVCRDATAMKALKPVVVEAAKAWEQAEADRAAMAKAVGKAAQKVAVSNAEAQRTLFQGHVEASTKVAFHQAAYGGFQA